MRIDVNCDLGESFGPFEIGSDEQVIPLVTSVNIACGFHGGDYRVMHETVRRAKASGVAIGAHPGLMDLYGFGRREMAVSPDEAYDLVLYQIGALAGFARVEGVPVQHVKPHGALYNMAAIDAGLATAIARAVYQFDPNLILFGLAGSELIAAGRAAGLRVAEEAFVDRNVQPDGTLVSRSHPNAFVTDPVEAADRIVHMLERQLVTALDGTQVPIHPDTICIHGDGPHALHFAVAVRDELKRQGVALQAIGQSM